MSSTEKDFYRVLGVIDSAEMVVIRAAYKALMMVYHPDRYEGDKEEAIRKTKEINEAYAVLIDPKRREKYATEQPVTKNQFEPNLEEVELKNTVNNELEAGWLIAIALVQGLDDLYQKLHALSPDLAFTFKLEIIESKLFDQAESIADRLEIEFIEKFFGKNKNIQQFSRWLLSQEKREAAKEVNKIVAVSGSNIDAYDVIKTIKIKYQLNYFQPEPINQPSSNYKLGDILQDNGIVFYLDESGRHGLAARAEDMPYKATWHEAKQLNATHKLDWHLPTKEELQLLYEHRNFVGGFSNHLYWSSTESNSFNAWFQNFFTGHQLNSNKNLTHRVRTVRSF
ncbi:MAG: DnaJ domain-containing protein [Methylococcaceae bacterium]